MRSALTKTISQILLTLTIPFWLVDFALVVLQNFTIIAFSFIVMALRDLYRWANVDQLSDALGMPIRIATDETLKKEEEELEAKSKLVKTLEDGTEIYEFEDEESEEEYSDEEGEPSSRNIKKSGSKQEASVEPVSDLAIAPIFSPFDTEAFPDPLNWPKEATLRLLSLVAVHGIFGDLSTEMVYYPFLAEKMASIMSNDIGLHEYCVDKEDWEHIGKVPAIELKPSYSIRPSPQECKEKLSQFYNMDYIKNKLMKNDKTIPFEYKKMKSSTPSSALTRSRRTGRPNPLVEALVEEKKQHKRASIT